MISYISNNRSAVFIFLISLLFCIVGIGNYPIYILDEAKNTEAAREMIFNGDFITPTFNNILRTDKPSLHYYFMLIGFKLFGVNAFGARFFSGIFGAFTMGISFYFVRKFSTKIMSKIFIVIVWSSIFFVQEFHLGVPDPYLIFFISSGLWFFYDFYKSKAKSSLWLMYILFGFGVLAKGPVALALPGLICLLFLISTKKFNIKNIFQYRPFFGLLLLLIIALPWYILVHFKTNGEWTHGFFIEHNINRFGSEMEGHGGIFLITWAFVLLGLMPFSFFIFHTCYNAYQKRKDSLVLFSATVCFVFIAFFSISGTKLPNYTMPCYPFLVFLISKYLWEFYKNGKRSLHVNIVVILLGILALAIPIVGKFALQQEEALSEISNTAYWLVPTTFFTMIGIWYYFKNHFEKAFLIIAFGWMLLNPALFLFIYPKLASKNPVEKAKSIIPAHSEMIAYKRFDSAFPFNFQRTFHIIETNEEISSFFNKFPKGYIITNDKNPLCLSTNKNLIMIFEGKALFESHVTRIFTKE